MSELDEKVDIAVVTRIAALERSQKGTLLNSELTEPRLIGPHRQDVVARHAS